MKTPWQVQFLFENRYHHINAHRNPYLRLDSVGGSAEKTLDSKILFDPFEELFYLPSALVEQSNG